MTDDSTAGLRARLAHLESFLSHIAQEETGALTPAQWAKKGLDSLPVISKETDVFLPAPLWFGIDTAPKTTLPYPGQQSQFDVDLWSIKENRRLSNCFWWDKHQSWFARSGGTAYNMGGDANFSHWMHIPRTPPMSDL